jgi:hypothetical protein
MISIMITANVTGMDNFKVVLDAFYKNISNILHRIKAYLAMVWLISPGMRKMSSR